MMATFKIAKTHRTLLILFAFSLSLLQSNVMAQVGGISGSKLGSYCVDVVDHHKVEFEPAFFHVRSSRSWDEDGYLDYIYGSADSVVSTYFNI